MSLEFAHPASHLAFEHAPVEMDVEIRLLKRACINLVWLLVDGTFLSVLCAMALSMPHGIQLVVQCSF